MKTVLVTMGLAFGIFLLMALFLALKRFLTKPTPLTAHACEVMCKHGKPQVCQCSADDPEGHHHENDGVKP